MTELQACLWPNVTLQGSYALSYSLLSAAELRDGIVEFFGEYLLFCPFSANHLKNNFFRLCIQVLMFFRKFY